MHRLVIAVAAAGLLASAAPASAQSIEYPSVAAALAVQSRLNETQLQLEETRGRIRYLDDQTSYGTITLDLRERGAVAAAGGDGWGIVDAWRDGSRAFVRVVAGTFVVVATLAPLAILALLSWLGYRAVRRRRAGIASAARG